MNGRWLRGIPAICVLTACGEQPAPQGPPPPPQVTVAHPVVRDIVEWDRYTGRLAATESVEVRARVSGYLQSIHFQEGQLVEKGDLLAVIDRRPYEAELHRAKALREEAGAGMERAQALLAQAEASLTQAESARKLAKIRLDNALLAVETNSIAQEQVDVRRSEFAQAEASVGKAQASIASANAEIATANAAIHTAEAEVERANLDLRYTRIEAAISGRISDRLVTKGNLIQGGSLGATLLTTIVSLDPMHVYFDANEQEFLKYLRLSTSGERPSSREYKNPVYLALIDEEGYPHQGHIDFVDNRIDTNTGTIRGRAIFRNGDLTLTPGLFATVRIPGSARYDAIMVPDAAIGSNQSQRFVMMVDDTNTVSPRAVTPGPLVDGLRVIREGLDGSERIVIGGLQRARPGSVVTPVDGTIEVDELDDHLPNDYQPLPEDEWITVDSDPLPEDETGNDR